ncbi:hypothetical protein ScPMuIL_008292 [Solemya velum]
MSSFPRYLARCLVEDGGAETDAARKPIPPRYDSQHLTKSKKWDPCDAQRILENLELRATSRKANESMTGDTNLIVDWYRFEPGYDMPTEPPESMSCSVDQPIWLNGPIPEVEEGVVRRTACTVYPAGESGFHTCYNYQDIEIKNCVDYRVYKLYPTNEKEGYCFEIKGAPYEYLCDTNRTLTDTDLRLNGEDSTALCDNE